MVTTPSFDYGRFISQLAGFCEPATIGFSFRGREIRAWRLGSLQQRPVLVVAGQHGDEKCSMLAAAKLISRFGQCAGEGCPAAWIVPCLNPDGAASNSRLSAQGLDLNRDHLARLSPEVQSLHNFIRRLEPCCLLDLHCFPSRRRWMRELNIEHASDLLVDWATGPAALMVDEPLPFGLSRITEWLKQESAEETFAVARYWLRSGRGRLRHSTPDWLDLRNQAAASYRIPTYLIEGREPMPQESNQHERTIDAMVMVATGILRAIHERSILAESSKSSRQIWSKLMPTSFQYQFRETIQTNLRYRIGHQPYLNSLGTKHTNDTLPCRYVRIARRLWIPKSLHSVIRHLQRLQAPLHDGEELLDENFNSAFDVIQFQVTRGKRTRKVLRNDRKVRVTKSKLLLSNAHQFVALTPSVCERVYWNALLDPRHKFSICRMHRNEFFRSGDASYPVLFQY